MANIDKWRKNYEQGTSGAGNKLVENYKDTPGKVAAASSDAAQKNYEAAMADKKVLQRRQNKLKKLTEDDLNRAMEAKGAQAYAAGTAASADKAATNVADFLNEQDRIKSSLPARTRDPAANVAARVTPFAVGLNKLKNSKA